MPQLNTVAVILWSGDVWQRVESGKSAFIDQRMDQYLYKSILQDNLSSSAEIVGLKDNFIFQHDNDPKHTARSVVEYLTVSGFKMLEWVAQSPD